LKKKTFEYEDNLGDKELNVDQILEKLLEFLGEDFAHELHHLLEGLDFQTGSERPFDPGSEKYVY